MPSNLEASWMAIGILLPSLLLAQIGLATVAAVDLPVEGNWIVTDKQVITDITRVLNGNITVAAGGELQLSNTVLVFNSTESRHHGIEVEEGGGIIMNRVRLTTVNASEGLRFISNGSVEIRRSRIEHIFGTTVALEWIGGFRIMSDNPIVEDSVFSEAVGFGPRFEGCDNVIFKNNEIMDSSTGLLFERSNGIIEGNLFIANHDRQVVIRDCGQVTFTNNTVNLTGMGAFIVTRSENVEASGNWYDGDFYVVYVTDHSKVQMSNEFITGDQVHIESSDNSVVTIIDSTVDPGKIRAKETSRVEVKRTVRIKVTSGGDPVGDATVTVKDSEKLLVAEGKTGEDGIVEFLLDEAIITPSSTGQGGGLEVAEPYRFRAVKGIYSGSGRADISQNPLLEMSMTLPWLFIIGAILIAALVIIVVVSPPGKGKKRPKKKKG